MPQSIIYHTRPEIAMKSAPTSRISITSIFGARLAIFFAALEIIQVLPRVRLLCDELASTGNEISKRRCEMWRQAAD